MLRCHVLGEKRRRATAVQDSFAFASASPWRFSWNHHGSRFFTLPGERHDPKILNKKWIAFVC
jgi:hypothetical protein